MEAGGWSRATGATRSSRRSTFRSTATPPAARCTSSAGPWSFVLLPLAAFVDSSLLLATPFAGCGFAWAGHFFFEGNRPATFRYLLWSVRGDFRMCRLMLLGQMTPELETR